MPISTPPRRAPVFNKSGDRTGPSSGLDWEEFEEELASINPDFSDPRFDSLSHVLTTLGSGRSQIELEELRAQFKRVEALVETVVDTYHSGFNTALHNYSRILVLFTESRGQLESLRRSLESASRRLNNGKTVLPLLDNYRQYLMLRDVVRLLDDVQAAITASTVTTEIQQSITGTANGTAGTGRQINWPSAVASLLNGCNKLSRSELSDVQALKDLRQDMSLKHTSLQQGLVAQLENWIFAGTTTPFNKHHDHHHLPPPSLTAGHLLDTDASVTVYVECLAQLGSVQVAQQDLLERLPSRLEEAVLQATQCLPLDQRASSIVTATTPSNNSNSNCGRMVPIDVSIAASNAMHAAVTTCEAVLKNTIKVIGLLCSVKSPSPSAGLVDLLFKKQQASTPEGAAIVIPQGGILGGEVAKRHSLVAWAIVQLQVQAVIADVLNKPPPTQLHRHLQPLGSPLSTTGNTGNISTGKSGQPLSPSSGGGKSHFLPKWLRDATTTAAAAGGTSKTDFQPSIVTFSLDHEDSSDQGFGGSSTNGTTSANDEKDKRSSTGTRRREELHAILGGSHHAAGPALLPSIYHEVVMFIQRAEQLVTINTGTATAVATQGGVQHQQQQQQQQTNKLGLPLLFIKNMTSSSSGETTSLIETEYSSFSASYNHLLRDYLDDDLVRLGFLPFVAVEVRARCVSVFSSSEAFQPQRNSSSSSSSSFAAMASMLNTSDSGNTNTNTSATHIGGGGNELASTNPLQSSTTSTTTISQLPAVVMIEELVEELMEWAEELPEFGAHLSGVIENALGRFAEGLTSALEAAGRGGGRGIGNSSSSSVSGGEDASLAGRLAPAASIARLMAQESAAALLGSSSAFSVSSFKQQRQGSGGGVNVHIVGGTHYGAHHNHHHQLHSHQNVSDRQILKFLLEEERPIHKNELLSGGSSSISTMRHFEESCRQLIAIAALGEAAERIADVTVQCMTVMTPNARTHYDDMQNDASSPSPLATTTAEQQQSSSSKWQAQLGITGMIKLGGSYLPTSLGGYGSSRPPTTTSNTDQEVSSTSGGGMSEGLYHLETQHRSLAGLAARILRLEMLALVIFHLSQLTYLDWSGGGGGGGGEGPVEADDRISAFTRKMTMIYTNLAPYLPEKKQQYVFGCVGPAVPRVMIQLLPEFDMISHAGAARACRVLTALQAAFGRTPTGGGGGSDGTIVKGEGTWWWSVSDNLAREYDLARLYYTLATHSPEGIIAAAKDKPHRFSKEEWMALLTARVVERQVKPQHKVDLEKVLEEAEKRDGSRRASQASTFQSAMQSLVRKALK